MSPHRTVRALGTYSLAAVGTGLPWPALLAATWARTGSDVWVGAAAAGRLAPYVVLSWYAGRLADRVPRLRLLRGSVAVRAVLLAAGATALAAGWVGVAVGAATLAVAAGTPAYPALVAALPGLAGRRSDAATTWLVTVEAVAWVVGPALGGLLLSLTGPTACLATAAVLVTLALLPALGLGRTALVVVDPDRPPLRRVLGRPGVRRALAAVVVVNWAESAVAVGLLAVAVGAWRSGDSAYGVATAALGLGSLLAPGLARLLGGVAAALLLGGVASAAVLVSPAVAWAAVPLALLGGATTLTEVAATRRLQGLVPADRLGAVLGLTDTVMVSAALVGAASTPVLLALLGPQGFLAVVAAVLLAGAVGLGLHREPATAAAATPAFPAAARPVSAGQPVDHSVEQVDHARCDHGPLLLQADR